MEVERTYENEIRTKGVAVTVALQVQVPRSEAVDDGR